MRRTNTQASLQNITAVFLAGSVWHQVKLTLAATHAVSITIEDYTEITDLIGIQILLYNSYSVKR
jgi:hypothetical protein